MAAILQRLGFWVVAIGVMAAVLVGLPTPALASIHTYHERPQQTTYRSRLTLPDRRDQAWQATLFHRYVQGQDRGIYLRLVAFPGSAAVAPTEDLKISTGMGLEWSAPADHESLPPSWPDNVGQYDLHQVLQGLSNPIPLTLAVPLVGGGTRQLVVAPYVVEEWQTLTAMTAPEAT